MRPIRAALLVAATALTPALLLTAPALAASGSVPAQPAASTTPVTTTPASACPDAPSDSGTPVDGMSEDELRAAIGAVLADPNAGRIVKSQATAALAGAVDGMRAFLTTGCTSAQMRDDAFSVACVLAVAQQNDDKYVRQAGSAALDAYTPEALRSFLETGYAKAQALDDALAVSRILTSAYANNDRRVAQEGNAAMDAGTPEALSYFRWTEYRLAQAEDDRVYIAHMLTDPDISDAMYDAIQAVLDDNSPEALRQFRTVGQYEVDA